MKTYELKREIPVCDDYDLVVAGGGPAGVCAAITAARNGMKTLLMENTGCLGGNWTSALMCVTHDAGDKGGIVKEIYEKLRNANAAEPLECNGFGSFIYDPEEMKLLLENLCRDSGVNVLLHTRATDAEVNAGTLTAVVAANHAGNQVYSAKTFLDCTGNGDLAAYAGCSYEAGHPENGKLQPTSLHALVTGVPENFKNTLQNRKRKIAFRDLLLSVGVEPSYQKPVLFKLVHGDIWAFCVTHMYGVRYDSPENVTNATIEGRKQIHDAVNALRTLPEWKNLRVVATSDLLGIREGRRIKGLYSVTTDDLEKGKKHEDGIGNVSFGVDVHALDSSNKGGFLVTSIKTKTYHIPFRSLISSEIGNLGMAGRCISGDFFAHSSYRQIGIAAAMGEAAGYAAAAARKDGITLSELDGTRVAGYMKRQGYVL